MAGRASEGRVEATDGTRIALRDHGGSGRPLILLHGGGANLESMDQYAARLGDRRRCVAIDLRACGQSGDPARFRLTDAADDVAAVVRALDLGSVDVVGHSMGGFVAGFFGTKHPDSRIVSIDGFGPGMVTVGSTAGRAEFRAFQEGMKAAFFGLTAPPECGDRAWRDHQVDVLCEVFHQIGYTAPNARAVAERNFQHVGAGEFCRRPPRHLFEDAFADDGDLDILRMYRHVACPTLVIRCTESGAPAVLDEELDALVAANPAVTVVRLPLTHLAPSWEALAEVAVEVERFWSDHPPPG
jgi:pimeloyl-ACP methyl ester carboxylesterase